MVRWRSGGGAGLVGGDPRGQFVCKLLSDTEIPELKFRAHAAVTISFSYFI